MKYFDMKQIIYGIFLSLIIFVGIPPGIRAQNPVPEEADPLELAAKEADRLGTLLNLEYWQIFYADSTLQHDFVGMKNELEDMMKTRVSNRDIYIEVQDKWMERIDSTYKTFFTKEQWKKYLKSGAKRRIKERKKRREKRLKATTGFVFDEAKTNKSKTDR